MMISSKEDFVWCKSCRVEALICCVKQVEFSNSPDHRLSCLVKCLVSWSHRRSLNDLPRQNPEWQGVSRILQEILILIDEGGVVYVCKNNIPGFKVNNYQFKFERCVGNVVIPRWEVDWVVVDNSKATYPGLVGVVEHVWFDSRVVQGHFWSPESHWFLSTFRLVPGRTERVKYNCDEWLFAARREVER